MLSPLRLEHCTVKRLEVLMGEATGPPGGEERLNVKLAMNVQKAADRTAFRVLMGVQLKPERGHEPNCRLKRLLVEAEAIFALPEDSTPDVIATYVPINCLAIVYGILRGYVMSACGAIGHGAVLLPSVEIGRMYKDLQEREARKQQRKLKKSRERPTLPEAGQN